MDNFDAQMLDMRKFKLLDKLSTFKGDKSENLLDYISDFMSNSDILETEEIKKSYFKSGLSGRALHFYKTENCDDLFIEEIIKKFKIEFNSNIKLEDIVDKLNSLRLEAQDDITDYIYRHMKYLREYETIVGHPMQEAMKKFYFFEGLGSKLKNLILRRNPRDIEDCYDFSKLEWELRDDDSDEKVENYFKKLMKEIEHLKLIINESQETQINILKVNKDTIYSKPNSQNTPVFYDSRPFKAPSPNPLRVKLKTSKRKKCKITRLNKLLIRNDGKLETKTEREDGDIIITVNIGDKSYRFLINKAYKNSVINRKIAKYLVNRNLTSWQRNIVNLRYLTNEKLANEIKLTTKVIVKIGPRSKRKDLTFVSKDINNNSYDGILGINFLKQFKIDIMNGKILAFVKLKDKKKNLEKTKSKKLRKINYRLENCKNIDSFETDRIENDSPSFLGYSKTMNARNENPYNQRWRGHNFENKFYVNNSHFNQELSYNHEYIKPNNVRFKKGGNRIFY